MVSELPTRLAWKGTSERVDRHVKEILVKTLWVPSRVLYKDRDELGARARLWGAHAEERKRVWVDRVLLRDQKPRSAYSISRI